MDNKGTKGMAKIAMLSVDLHLAGAKRPVFNEELKTKNWKKLLKLTTVWTTNFKEGTTITGIINRAKTDVKAAAKTAKITRYDAVVHVGDSSPTVF
ncbi:MAG: hypothetical protein V3T88_04525 [Nitrosomonadaceae bacterium]